MLEPPRRIIAGIYWVFGSLVAWSLACNGFIFVFEFPAKEKGLRPPAAAAAIYDVTSIAGIFILTVGVTILAMRGKLPWTRLRPFDGSACRNCGYDLRASPDHCPECGEISPRKEMSSN